MNEQDIKVIAGIAVFLTALVGTSAIIQAVSKYSSHSTVAALELTDATASFPKLDHLGSVEASAFLIETTSGRIVAARDRGIPYPPASLAKLMTAFLLQESGKEADITVTDRVKNLAPRISSVPVGARISSETARSLLLIESDNDIAEAIAEKVGSIMDPRAASPREIFINAMNQKAKTLGLHATRYDNPVGFDDDAERSSVEDLAILVRAILKQYPHFLDVTGDPPRTLALLSGGSVPVSSSNLIRSHEGLVGAKTGFTGEAKGALVMLYRSKYYPEDFVVVLLHSPNRFHDGEILLNAIEHAFKKQAL